MVRQQQSPAGDVFPCRSPFKLNVEWRLLDPVGWRVCISRNKIGSPTFFVVVVLADALDKGLSRPAQFQKISTLYLQRYTQVHISEQQKNGCGAVYTLYLMSYTGTNMAWPSYQ